MSQAGAGAELGRRRRRQQGLLALDSVNLDPARLTFFLLSFESDSASLVEYPGSEAYTKHN